MTVGDYLQKKLKEKGASIVEFADLSGIRPENRRDYPRGILIGVALDPEVIKGIENGPTLQYYDEFNRVNSLLNQLGEYTEKLLKENGYAAWAKTQKVVEVDEKTRSTELPHKTVATRAGAGWIGKSALLVTEEYGSALRISTVLTNAELKTGTPVDRSKCGDCTVCRDCCPGKAVTGDSWEVGKDRDEFYKAFDCRRAAMEKAGEIGVNATLCGLCIVKCPWTQRYLKGSLPVESIPAQ